MIRYIILIIILFLTSCNKKDSKKIEIVFTDKDNNVEIKEYDENKLKEDALNTLKEFYSLSYNPNDVYIAYDKFYSSKYKEILKKTRNIYNAEDYVNSEPSLDFEFKTTIDKVHDIKLEGQKAYIDVDSTVYDMVQNITSKAKQTFILFYENGKWVIS